MAQDPKQPQMVTFVGRRLTQLYEYDRVAIYGFLQNAATGKLRNQGVPANREADLESIQKQILELSVGVEDSDLAKSNKALEKKRQTEKERREKQKQQPIDKRESAKRALFNAECSDWKTGRLIREPGDKFHAGEFLEPDQQIRRMRHPASILPDWKEIDNAERPSKFVTSPVEWAGTNPSPESLPRRWRYFNPYDLLGLFLSLLGPAPPGATGKNFYLPLAIVFARWCSQIGGHRAGGKGPLPFMLQCTWVKSRAQRCPFFLGASLGGYDWEAELGNWKRELRFARYELVEGIVDPIPDLGYLGSNPSDLDFDRPAKFLQFEPARRQLAIIEDIVGRVLEGGTTSKSSMLPDDKGALKSAFRRAKQEINRLLKAKKQQVQGNNKDQGEQKEVPKTLQEYLKFIQRAAGKDDLKSVQEDIDTLWQAIQEKVKDVRFGNCAETYPFLNLLLPLMESGNVESSQGLAIRRDSATKASYPTSIKGLTPPCANCSQLLRNLGFVDPARFKAKKLF